MISLYPSALPTGELTAEVRGPSGKIPVAVDQRNDGRNTVIFTPREQGRDTEETFVPFGGPSWPTPHYNHHVRILQEATTLCVNFLIVF